MFIFKLDETPLYLAIENGNDKIVKLLLTNNKIEINEKYVFM